MGNTHFKSNILGKAGTETISNFASVGATAVSGTTVTATGALQGATVVSTSDYITIGTNKYIFTGGDAVATELLATINALVATPFKGSLYLGDTEAWLCTSDTAMTKI